MRAARWLLAGVLLAGCGTAVPPFPTVVPPLSDAVVTSTGDAGPPETSAVDPPGTAPAAAEPNCAWDPCYADPVDGGTLPDTVPEASGIAASGSDPDLYFVVDDGTGAAALTAVRSDGSLVGVVDVDGMSADNAEAVVAGSCPAGRCLYVGDIGGNNGREVVTVYRAAEPTLPLPSSVASERWDYRYPDGSWNAEAMLVTDAGGIVIITKPGGGEAPHRVYTGVPGGGDLVLRTTFSPPDPASPSRSLMVGNVVTDAARNADTVLLLTYDHAIEYRAPGPDADPADFPTWERRVVPVPRQWQSEGVSHRAAGVCGYVVVSERSPMGAPAIGTVPCR